MPALNLTKDIIATNYARGIWHARTLSDVVDDIAASRPDAPAVADQHEQLSYAEFVRRTRALSAWLVGQGLDRGAAVAIQTPNRVALPLMHFACDRADLTYVPLSDAWRRVEMAHLLKTARVEVLVVPEATADVDYPRQVNELRAELPDLRLVGVIDGDAGNVDFSFAEVSTRTAGDGTRPHDANDGKYVMVTSGTTEAPRMSLWSDNNLWFFMRQFRDAVQLNEKDVAVGLCPANTGAIGYVFPVLGPLLTGASSVLLERWDAKAALDLLESARANLATAVPTQAMKMMQDDSLAGRDFSALRVFTNSGAAMPPHAARRMEQAFGCVGQVVYGATDGGSVAMSKIVDPPEKRFSTVGRLTDFCEMRFVDALNQDVPEGGVGEMLWRTPTKSFGYLNDPERNETAFDGDGWYRSGDLGRLDAEGYLSIVGRAKDLIIRGGQNISPNELEILISRHPAVAEVSVIGLPDPLYGERACACVVPLGGQHLTLDSIIDFLAREGVAKFKFPEHLELFDDLPKSAGGKITKVALRVALARRLEGAAAGTGDDSSPEAGRG
jgi:non-ribosomal peptide synthetase component E (peptide arylation enzyme)